MLPGDPARAILGPLAAPSAVKALDHQLGTDKPIADPVLDWIGHLVHGDIGHVVLSYQSPIGPF